jgi:hypothetical protein
MALENCHPSSSTSRERARLLILKVLGVKRVAAWCGVGEATVYQWLGRGTEDEPIPAARVPAIVAGARADNLDAPIDVLWPALAAAQVGG